MKKFELSEEKKIDNEGIILYRIRACKDFTTYAGERIKTGQLGGWVENEKNLSQEYSCWIFDDAIVRDNAIV